MLPEIKTATNMRMTTDDMWYGVLGMKNGCMKYVVCSYVQKESLINLWILLTTEHMSVYTLKLRIGSNAVWNHGFHNMSTEGAIITICG